MMIIKKLKLGFSLIELSVVILIIGILVLGVTQGSRILTEVKLKSAIALTTSSPVTATLLVIATSDTFTVQPLQYVSPDWAVDCPDFEYE